MEKSIENIWKEGFLNQERLSAPSIENIASLKSIYFIDQFKKTYKTNIIVLMATAILILFAFVLGGVPLIGMMMFGLFATLAILGNRELEQLNRLDKGATSYEFVKAFDHWLKNLLTRFSLIYRVWIPLFFIGFVLAILQTNFFIPFIGETLLERFFGNATTYLIAGVPLVGLIALIVFGSILSYFSDRFFKMEMKSIYGEILHRLDQLLVEMEAMR